MPSAPGTRRMNRRPTMGVNRNAWYRVAMRRARVARRANYRQERMEAWRDHGIRLPSYRNRRR